MTLENRLRSVETVQASELQGVAREMFDTTPSTISQKTKISGDERSLLLVNGQMFNTILDMPELDPSHNFMEKSASVDGWKTNKFVEASQHTNTNRQNTGVFDRLAGLFQRKDTKQ